MQHKLWMFQIGQMVKWDSSVSSYNLKRRIFFEIITSGIHSHANLTANVPTKEISLTFPFCNVVDDLPYFFIPTKTAKQQWVETTAHSDGETSDALWWDTLMTIMAEQVSINTFLFKVIIIQLLLLLHVLYCYLLIVIVFAFCCTVSTHTIEVPFLEYAS